MKKTNATRETILSVNDYVELISENGSVALLGKSKLTIDDEDVTVFGTFSCNEGAVEACILFEGDDELTKDNLYPKLLESFELPNDGSWKYWLIGGDWDDTTTVGEVLDSYNEYGSGYWHTGKWTISTPEEIERAKKAAELERKKALEELKKMGFAYCPNYSKGNMYEGQNSYHTSHRNGYYNTPVKKSKYPFSVGIELEVCATSSINRKKICDVKSNWFFRETDSSLDDNGVEFITIPLRFEDATNLEFWQPFTEWLSKYARSWDTGCCGLHVHIGNEIFDVDGFDEDMLKAKLAYAYNYCIDDDPINKAVFGRARGYNAEKCKTQIADAVKVISSKTKKNTFLNNKDVTDAIVDETKDVMKNNRYYDINYSNDKTTEFRKGRGSINAERIVSVITYCYMMTEWSKKESWSNLLDIQKFLEFLKKKTPKTSPLCRYINSDEREF